MINRYIAFSFLKAMTIVLLSCSVIIAIVLISQELIGIPNLTNLEKLIILSAGLISMNNTLFVFYIAISGSIMIMEFGRTSQFVIMLSSGVSTIKVLKMPIIISFSIGLFIIFCLNPLEIILKEKAHHILKDVSNKNEYIAKVNLRDIDIFENKMIINADYVHKIVNSDDVDFKNIVITRQKNGTIFEVIKADNMRFIVGKKWMLEDVSVLNNETKTLINKKDLLILGQVSRGDLLKQIDGSTQNIAGSSKKYNIYQLSGMIIFNSGISNESKSTLKSQFWSILSIPIQMLCAILVLPIIIGNKSVTRNGLKLNAIFIPQCFIGVYSYFISMIGNFVLGAAKYEFTLVFMPYLGLLSVLIFLCDYKKLK